MRHYPGFGVALLAVLSLGGPPLSARQAGTAPRPAQTAPTFRLQVNYVEIDAIVTDAKGQFVRGLTPADFEVTENGVRQEVGTLALVDLPIVLDVSRTATPPSTAPAPDVASNTPSDDGRVYLLVLDTHHVDASRTPLVRRRAREFVEQYLQPGDRAAIVHIGYPTLNQEFTTNKAWLLRSIGQFIGEKTSSSTVAIANADPDGPPPDAEAGVREAMAQRTVFALGELSNYLAGMRGRRKTLVFFSEGLDVDVTDQINQAHLATDLFSKLQDTYAAAARSNVAFYTIDPRGVADIGEDLMQVRGNNGGWGTSSPAQGLYGELRVAQNSMRNLAEVTGGLTSVGSADVAAAFTHIVEDASHYYLLGYHSTDTRLDGKERRISVRVTRPGLQVRARHSYYADTPATAGRPADPIAELLNGPVAMTGLRMQAVAAAMPGIGDRAHVHLTLEMNGEDLAFDPVDGKFANDVEIAYRATDQKGQVQAHGRDTMTLRLDPAVRRAVGDRGLRYAADFEAPAGRYQVRIAVVEHSGGHLGSVYCDLEVPAFDKDPIVLSDLLVTARSAGRTPSARPTGSLADLLPWPPTTVREFADEDTLVVFVDLRNNDRRRRPVSVTTTVVGEGGSEEFRASERRDPTAGDSGPGVRTEVPLAGMTPGQYEVVIEARLEGEAGPSVTRQLLFRIK